MTESRNGPKGFIVVLPREIIEIPQDDDKSWLTLFYALPKELVEKFPAALEIPRCPYEVLRTDKYDRIVKDDMIVAEQQWQPVIDAAWEMRSPEDYDDKFSVPKNDFMRKWHHNRSGRSISLDKMMETEDGSVLAIADPRAEFEKDIMDENQIEAFKKSTLTDKDQEILRLRMLGHTEQEIADKLGYKTASAVHKRIAKIASIYEDFVTGEYQKYLDKPSN